jgi:transcriptional regulator with XRE-family HTH domain
MIEPNENPATEVRSALGVSRKLFSRMTGFSERAIADWESGKKLGTPALLRIKEMARLRVAMADVMRPASIPRWLETPCNGLGGLTPIECLERGETDRVWRTIFYLGSGVPT